MHFWIDKSRFGGHPCALNAANRHRLFEGGRCRRCPKPNVVPVHRFNSVENIHSPHQPHHHPHHQTPLSAQSSPHPNTRHPGYTPSQISERCSSLPARIINMEDDADEENLRLGSVYIHNMTYAGGGGTGTHPRNNFKVYGVLPSLVLAFILIAYTKFYFDTQRGGYEMVTIIGIFGLFAITWHAVYRHSSSLSSGTLCTAPTSLSSSEPVTHLISTVQDVAMETPSLPTIATIPPPPYHIAVLLPSDPKDLPPPSYDLAVQEK